MELKIVLDDKTLDVLAKIVNALTRGEKTETVSIIDASSNVGEEQKQVNEKSPAVPVSEVAYSFDQLQACAGKLVQEGKREELFKIVQDMGIKSLPELDKSRFNELALRLREIGGVI